MGNEMSRRFVAEFGHGWQIERGLRTSMARVH